MRHLLIDGNIVRPNADRFYVFDFVPFSQQGTRAEKGKKERKKKKTPNALWRVDSEDGPSSPSLLTCMAPSLSKDAGNQKTS